MAITKDPILDIRDAIVEDLTTVILPDCPAGSAVEAAYSLSDDETLVISVVAGNVEMRHEDAGDVDTEEDAILIVVRQAVDRYDVSTIDGLVNIVRAIQRRYIADTRLKALSGDTAGLDEEIVVSEKLSHPFYSQHLLDTTGYFQSTTVLTFRNWVDR